MSALALTTLATAASCGKKGNQPYTPGTPLKVGLICLHNEASTYDKNFITAFTNACEAAKANNIISEYSIKTDVPEEGRDCYNAAEEFVNQGYNIICSDSFGHDVSMHEAAKEFTNVQFTSATGIEARKSGLSNFHNAFASIYEGRYLLGVAAGQHLLNTNAKGDKTYAAKLGYVGAYPYAEVISGYTSWFLGVKSILPNVTMKVTYTNSWYSEELEGTAAQKLIDDKCELISQHADSMGAPNVCAKAGIPNVSYNIDTSIGGGDELKASYLGHSRIDWTPYYKNLIKSVYEGKPIENEIEQNWTGSLQTGSVQINLSKEKWVDANVAEAVANAQKELESKKLHVFDTNNFAVKELEQKCKEGYYEFPPVKGTDYTMDEGTGHLTSMKGATDMYDRDTELVKSEGDASWIQESVFRSAPSFDFIIDGISKL